MEKLDQQAMQKLADDAQAMGQEIEALCKKGKRDAAKNIAMEFGLKMSDVKICESYYDYYSELRKIKGECHSLLYAVLGVL